MKRITILKLSASTLLLCASLGLLWHSQLSSGIWGRNYFRAELNVQQLPFWVNFGLPGWYPDVSGMIYKIYLQAPWLGLSYVAVNLLCLASLFCIPFIQNKWARLGIGIPVLALFAFELTILDVGGGLPDRSIITTMIADWRQGLKGTIVPYLREIGTNIAFVALLAVPILWKPAQSTNAGRVWPLAVVMVSLLGVVVLYNQIKPENYGRRFVSPVASALYFVDSLRPIRERTLESTSYAGGFGPQAEKIIVVMDESIRGDFTSLGDPSMDTTPFLASISDQLANFGVASSAANCSRQARQSFRHLMPSSQVNTPLADLIRRPTIWQYARNAGYKTYHFDAFGSPLILTSGMGRVERSFIDERTAMMTQPYYERDVGIAEKLRQIMREPGRKFIFVEKYGTHVPYSLAYPPKYNWHGADVTKEFNLDDRVELIKHYKNAIHWSVDNFFTELFRDAMPDNLLLIYTSDHGQSLSEGGIKLSHCSFTGTMRAGEAAVPLFAFSTNQGLAQALKEKAKDNKDIASHYNIAPTVLVGMGYNIDWVAKNVDLPLMSTIPRDQKRFVRFGTQAVEFVPPAPIDLSGQ